MWYNQYNHIDKLGELLYNKNNHIALTLVEMKIIRLEKFHER